MAQWQTIGGENGIGIGDLDPDQRDLWTDILPQKMTVQKSTITEGKKPGSTQYSDTTRR